MKKMIFKGTVFFSIIALTVVACKKEKLTIETSDKREIVQVDNKLNISSDKKMLIFKTVEDYEKIASNPSDEVREDFLSKVSKMKHTTYAESIKNEKSGNDMLGDDYLAQILNEDGVVQIEDHLYRVNKPDESVFVLPVSKISEYQDLISENTFNENLQVYSTQDDVIDEVNKLGKSCGGIDGDDYDSDIQTLGQVNGSDLKMITTVRMFRAGIYFRLSAFNTITHQGLVTMKLEIGNGHAWAQKRPCKSNDTFTSALGVKKTSANNSIWEFYSGVRNLNGFYLYARTTGTFINPISGVTIVKTTSYGGRNINSPY